MHRRSTPPYRAGGPLWHRRAAGPALQQRQAEVAVPWILAASHSQRVNAAIAELLPAPTNPFRDAAAARLFEALDRPALKPLGRLRVRHGARRSPGLPIETASAPSGSELPVRCRERWHGRTRVIPPGRDWSPAFCRSGPVRQCQHPGGRIPSRLWGSLGRRYDLQRWRRPASGPGIRCQLPELASISIRAWTGQTCF